MVFVQKTYNRAQSLSMKITIAVVFVLGFFTLIFMSPVKTKLSVGADSSEAGVAHADATGLGGDSSAGDSSAADSSGGTSDSSGGASDSSCGTGGDCL